MDNKIEIKKDIILNGARFRFYPDSRGVTIRDHWEYIENGKGKNYIKITMGWKSGNKLALCGHEKRLEFKEALRELNKNIKKGE